MSYHNCAQLNLLLSECVRAEQRYGLGGYLAAVDRVAEFVGLAPVTVRKRIEGQTTKRHLAGRDVEARCYAFLDDLMDRRLEGTKALAEKIDALRQPGLPLIGELDAGTAASGDPRVERHILAAERALARLQSNARDYQGARAKRLRGA